MYHIQYYTTINSTFTFLILLGRLMFRQLPDSIYWLPYRIWTPQHVAGLGVKLLTLGFENACSTHWAIIPLICDCVTVISLMVIFDIPRYNPRYMDACLDIFDLLMFFIKNIFSFLKHIARELLYLLNPLRHILWSVRLSYKKIGLDITWTTLGLHKPG